MSIVATVKVSDGVVLGADSQTQVFGQIAPNQVGWVKSFSNAKKLFAIKNKPIGVLTYGIGNIGTRSIENHVVDFSDSIENENVSEVKDVAERLRVYLTNEFTKAYASISPQNLQQQLGIVVAGYSDGKPFAEEWEFLVPTFTEVKMVRPADAFGASWRGHTIPFTRVYQGLDPRIPAVLKSGGFTDEQITKIQGVLPQLALQTPFNGMPMQDAVDYCRFIIETTIDYSQFEVGQPICGRPVDIAVIAHRDRTLRWMSEKVLK